MTNKQYLLEKHCSFVDSISFYSNYCKDVEKIANLADPIPYPNILKIPSFDEWLEMEHAFIQKYNIGDIFTFIEQGGRAIYAITSVDKECMEYKYVSLYDLVKYLTGYTKDFPNGRRVSFECTNPTSRLGQLSGYYIEKIKGV